jgi:hypothetical protein
VANLFKGVGHTMEDSYNDSNRIVVEPEQALRARSVPLKQAELERLRKQHAEVWKRLSNQEHAKCKSLN